MMSSRPCHHLAGWLLDAYPVQAGMVVWGLDDEGGRHRLVDPYAPAFYLAGPPSDLALAVRLLARHTIAHQSRIVHRRELEATDRIPVLEVAIADPTRFQAAVALVMKHAPHLRFYHADVTLPQRYFYDRGLFPLCRYEADVTDDA